MSTRNYGQDFAHCHFDERYNVDPLYKVLEPKPFDICEFPVQWKFALISLTKIEWRVGSKSNLQVSCQIEPI